MGRSTPAGRPRDHARRAFTLGAASLIVAGPAFAQPAASPPPPTPSEPPAEQPSSVKVAQDNTLRLKVAVMIDGKGPFDFLIDTGSDRTVISHELAEALALPKGPEVIMHQAVGEDRVLTVVVRNLVIGDHTVDRVEAPVVMEKDLGAAGLLGIDALHDLHVVMDFQARRLSTSPSRPEPLENGMVVVHGRSRFGQLVLVDAQIKGVAVYVVLDTGSELSVGNTELRRLLTGRARALGKPIETQLISVTGRHMPVELEDIDQARIGGLAIHNLPVGFAELPIFRRFGLESEPAMLLGMDVLSLCRKVTIDFRRREATFTLNDGG
jgi:predicted aspartyl protease